ncbi:hypothetical protein D3C81_1398450 [compost metagenome]
MLGLGNILGATRNRAVGLITCTQGVEQLLGDLLAGKLASGVDGIDVGHFADFGEVGLTWQREHFGDHGLVQLLVGQHRAQRGHQALIKNQPGALLVLGNQLLQDLHRQLLPRFPAVETITVVLHEEHQLVTVIGEAQLDRCAETTQ